VNNAPRKPPDCARFAWTVERDVKTHAFFQEQMQRRVKGSGVAQVPDDLAAIHMVSKKPNSMRLSGGNRVSGLLCIISAVSAFKMRLP